jgi:hypothetical protein
LMTNFDAIEFPTNVAGGFADAMAGSFARGPK